MKSINRITLISSSSIPVIAHRSLQADYSECIASPPGGKVAQTDEQHDLHAQRTVLEINVPGETLGAEVICTVSHAVNGTAAYRLTFNSCVFFGALEPAELCKSFEQQCTLKDVTRPESQIVIIGDRAQLVIQALPQTDLPDDQH